MSSPHTPIELPDVSGLRARSWRGLEDVPAMADAVRSDESVHGIDRRQSTEGMVRHYKNMSNCDPERDIIILEVDGAVAGYGRTTWRRDPNGGWVHYVVGAVHADQHHRGLGTAILGYLERRVRANAGSLGEGPHRAEGWAIERQIAAQRMFEKLGYAVIAVDVDMLRPDLENLPEAALPKGLVVRPPAGVDDMRKVYDADVEAFRDHFGFTEPTDGDFQDFLDFEWSDPTLWRVAWDGDEVVGQVRSFIDRDENEGFGRKRGYTEFISTVRPWRRKGVARALLVASLLALKERGMTEAGLGVHTDNPHNALGLYESVGFTTVERSSTYAKTVID